MIENILINCKYNGVIQNFLIFYNKKLIVKKYKK